MKSYAVSGEAHGQEEHQGWGSSPYSSSHQVMDFSSRHCTLKGGRRERFQQYKACNQHKWWDKKLSVLQSILSFKIVSLHDRKQKDLSFGAMQQSAAKNNKPLATEKKNLRKTMEYFTKNPIRACSIKIVTSPPVR